MKNLFVPYGLALKLKEKGFNEPCLALFNNSDKPVIAGNTPVFNSKTEDDSIICVPTYQQVVDWFRINKDLYSVVFPTTNKGMYCAVLYRLPNNEIYQSIERFDDYYNALNKLINESINLI